jgi:hypothetical protein
MITYRESESVNQSNIDPDNYMELLYIVDESACCFPTSPLTRGIEEGLTAVNYEKCQISPPPNPSCPPLVRGGTEWQTLARHGIPTQESFAWQLALRN